MKLYKTKFINKMTLQKKRLTGSLTKHKAFCIPFGQVLDRPFQKVPFFSFFKTWGQIHGAGASCSKVGLFFIEAAKGRKEGLELVNIHGSSQRPLASSSLPPFWPPLSCSNPLCHVRLRCSCTTCLHTKSNAGRPPRSIVLVPRSLSVNVLAKRGFILWIANSKTHATCNHIVNGYLHGAISRTIIYQLHYSNPLPKTLAEDSRLSYVLELNS